MFAAEVLHGGHDGLGPVEAGHHQRERGHELLLLLGQVAAEHMAQRRGLLEQAGVEEIGGERGDGLDLLEAGLHSWIWVGFIVGSPRAIIG